MNDTTATINDNTSGFRPEVLPNPTAGAEKSLADLPRQSTFLSGIDLAALMVAAHLADPSETKRLFIAACIRVLLAALASGPCSMAHARARAGLASPDGIDGRAAGAATAALLRAGLIEPVGRFDRSPWRNCHASPSQVWRLATARRLTNG